MALERKDRPAPVFSFKGMQDSGGLCRSEDVLALVGDELLVFCCETFDQRDLHGDGVAHGEPVGSAQVAGQIDP